MVGSEARLVGRKKARVFKIGKQLKRDQTFKSLRDEWQVGNWSEVLAGLVRSRLGFLREGKTRARFCRGG